VQAFVPDPRRWKALAVLGIAYEGLTRLDALRLSADHHGNDASGRRILGSGSEDQQPMIRPWMGM